MRAVLPLRGTHISLDVLHVKMSCASYCKECSDRHFCMFENNAGVPEVNCGMTKCSKIKQQDWQQLSFSRVGTGTRKSGIRRSLGAL